MGSKRSKKIILGFLLPLVMSLSSGIIISSWRSKYYFVHIDSFEQEIIESTYRIRKSSKRPDVDSILKIISSNSANNITIIDVEVKINLLLSIKKIGNRQSKRDLDSLDRESQFIDRSVVEHDSTNSSNDVTVSILVETPKIENLKTTTLTRDPQQDLKAQIMARKANFMNEMFELQSDIEGLKKQIWDRSSNKNNIYDDNNLEILKAQSSCLQKENQFVKHELQQKRLVIEKLLHIKENSLGNNY